MKYLTMMLALLVVAPGAVAQPKGAIPIDLKKAMGPDNQYSDAATGVSVTLPNGWIAHEAYRWGEGQRENTVLLAPRWGLAKSRMYYRPYTADEQAAIARGDARGLLREQAQLKEASRREQVPDYQNVPASFLFFEANGRQGLAYLASFMGRDDQHAEHFIRVLGPKGYVMFFTMGPFEDVKAIIPKLMEMAASVAGPQ